LLDQLFGAAMKQPDMRIDAGDNLAIQFEHEAQNAMGGWMLRPEIDGEVAEVLFVHWALRALANGE
jgi:hypothetical protein